VPAASTTSDALPAPSAATPRRRRLPAPSPRLLLASGALLIVGGVLLSELEAIEGAPPPTPAQLAAQQEAQHQRLQQMALQRAREREAAERAEADRRAAEEAAEKARRAEVMVDGTAEALARAQREEIARKQAAVEAAQRAAHESEAAWKRFYQPSPGCRDAAASSTVECINEFVKAKRAFEEQRARSG
jgi:type IV secretory pathway VirB10-like protein